MNDPYALPDGTLRNLLGITDPAQLAAAEADITHATLIRIAAHPVPGSYDLPHLQAFHRAIFGLVYEWAGQLRTVEISKETGFCRTEHLEAFAGSVFAGVPAPSQLAALPRSAFLDRLTSLYGDINALHPFREGNGRTQRAFLSQLATESGYQLSWRLLDAEQNRRASIQSHNGDDGALRAMLDRLLT
ncbi:Fic/DOC family protein [Kitasatospora sp. NPDC051853]|uniref:Fic/DOC family protein n=1 Tax=Kitasatospora sp. NPDC051853 TaxID=3364058 RepID=UPI00378A48BB